MSGTKIGGQRAAATNKAKHGADFYKRIGAISGKVKNPNKGFGSDRERARSAGRIGGLRSKRGKSTTTSTAIKKTVKIPVVYKLRSYYIPVNRTVRNTLLGRFFRRTH